MESGRYDTYGPEMLRLQDRGGRELVYGPTNEEMITALLRRCVSGVQQRCLVWCIMCSGSFETRHAPVLALCGAVSS